MFAECANNCDTCDDVIAGQCDPDGCKTNFIFNPDGTGTSDRCVARTYHCYCLIIGKFKVYYISSSKTAM